MGIIKKIHHQEAAILSLILTTTEQQTKNLQYPANQAIMLLPYHTNLYYQPCHITTPIPFYHHPYQTAASQQQTTAKSSQATTSTRESKTIENPHHH